MFWAHTVFSVSIHGTVLAFAMMAIVICNTRNIWCYSDNLWGIYKPRSTSNFPHLKYMLAQFRCQ